MPRRELKLETDGVYHIMNRGAGGINLFRRKTDFSKFVFCYSYYAKQDPQLRLSKLNELHSETKISILNSHVLKDNLIDIYSFCIMPNHFHFLVKQLKESGVLNWIKRASNSYSSYFNRRYKRKGHLFQGSYKAVKINTDEQLIHCTRYIHLNPYVASLCSKANLADYKWSSLGVYLNRNKSNFEVNTKEVSAFFTSKQDFQKFTYDHADYAKNMHEYKDVLLE